MRQQAREFACQTDGPEIPRQARLLEKGKDGVALWPVRVYTKYKKSSCIRVDSMNRPARLQDAFLRLLQQARGRLSFRDG